MSDERVPAVGDTVRYYAVGSQPTIPEGVDMTVTTAHTADIVSGTFMYRDGLNSVRFLRRRDPVDPEHLTHTQWWDWPDA